VTNRAADYIGRVAKFVVVAVEYFEIQIALHFSGGASYGAINFCCGKPVYVSGKQEELEKVWGIKGNLIYLDL